jgi:autotransporter-associated beta strand protein
LALSGDGSIKNSSKVTVDSEGTFDVQNVSQNTSVKDLQGSGSVELGSKELKVEKGTFSGIINGTNGTLTKTGTNNTLTLSGTNNYTGETKIEAGTLALTGNSNLEKSSGVTFTGNGTLNVSGITDTSIQALNGTTGKVVLGSNELKVEKGTFGGVISGNGTLTKTGTDKLTLSGVNTYTGATNIKEGIFELTGSVNNTSTINVAANATLDVKGAKKLNNLSSAGAVTFNSNLELAGNDNTTITGLNGTADVTKTGNGTTTLVNNTVNKFVQEKGESVLTGTLTGNYEQKTSAQNFIADAGNANTATIAGNAYFDSNVILKSKTKVTGNLEFGDDATVNIDFTKLNFTDAVISVDGMAMIDGDAKLNIQNWTPGTRSASYALLYADITVTGKFDNSFVTFDNNAANNRQGFDIIKTTDQKQLNLVTFTKNQVITHKSGTDWSTSVWDDRSIVGSGTQQFYNGDYVIFNSTSNQKQTINNNIDVVTAGMRIASGNWSFTGNKITGTKQTDIFTSGDLTSNDGKLTVTGNTASATFKNAIKFDDISVTDKAKLNLLENKTVETGTLRMDTGTKLTLRAVENKITATSDVVLNGDVEFSYDKSDPTKSQIIPNVVTSTNGTISGDFLSKGFSRKLLSYTGAKLVDNDTKLNFVYNASTVSGFAKFQKLSGNTARIGDLIDVQNYANSELLQQLYDLKSGEEEKFAQILTGQLAPELAADALQLSLWQPYTKVFKRLYETGDIYSNNINGQSITRRNYELWFEGFYRGENVSHDSFAGSYKSTRGGLLTGIETRLEQKVRTGLFFSYTNPRVTNEIGRIDADDISFGAYSRIKLRYGSFLNAAIAYGNQDYNYKRNNKSHIYNGDAMYAGIELFRPVLWRNDLQLVPLFAVDFQKAWMKGFTIADTNQVIEKSEIDQFVLRIGLNSKFQPANLLDFRTRLQYSIQVGGDQYGSVKTSYLHNPTHNRTLTSVNLGRNMLNVGVGTDLYISNNKCTRIFGDYDFDLREHSLAHTGQFGIITTW